MCVCVLNNVAADLGIAAPDSSPCIACAQATVLDEHQLHHVPVITA